MDTGCQRNVAPVSRATRPICVEARYEYRLPRPWMKSTVAMVSSTGWTASARHTCPWRTRTPRTVVQVARRHKSALLYRVSPFQSQSHHASRRVAGDLMAKWLLILFAVLVLALIPWVPNWCGLGFASCGGSIGHGRRTRLTTTSRVGAGSSVWPSVWWRPRCSTPDGPRDAPHNGCGKLRREPKTKESHAKHPAAAPRSTA